MEKAASRHRRQPARLVDRHDRIVFADDAVVGRHLLLAPGRTMPHHDPAGVEDGVGGGALAFNLDFAAVDAARPFLA